MINSLFLILQGYILVNNLGNELFNRPDNVYIEQSKYGWCTEMVRYKGILGSSYLKLGIRQKVRIYVVSVLNSWLVEMKKPKYTLVKFAFVHPFSLDMFRTQVLF